MATSRSTRGGRWRNLRARSSRVHLHRRGSRSLLTDRRGGGDSRCARVMRKPERTRQRRPEKLGVGCARISTSSIFFGTGVAGVYSVVTLPEPRGEGVGAVLTLNPLLFACEVGYRIGVLQSSEMGCKVFERLGFWHLCLVEWFYLSNGKSDRGSRT